MLVEILLGSCWCGMGVMLFRWCVEGVIWVSWCVGMSGGMECELCWFVVGAMLCRACVRGCQAGQVVC